MENQIVATAMKRMESAFQRRPEAALHEDPPATARWQSGMRVASSHANGTQLLTDMPSEIGGTGDLITPGWLLRAALASCAATRIVMAAAAEGITLSALEVQANSRSDIRGLLGMADSEGESITAGPLEMHLLVRIAASGVSPERLHALVEDSHRCSPVSAALLNALPVDLQVEIDTE